MITRKGLNALVVGLADGAADGGLTRQQATAVAAAVVGSLRDAGVVTPAFDSGRFADALTDALADRAVMLAA